MPLNNFSRKYLLFFLLATIFPVSGWSSTITVTPSEAQTQIQASINNSHSGDTIYFQAGTYSLKGLRLAAGRTYLGSTSGQTTVHWSGGSAVMVFYGSGLTVQHFTFDGGGLYLGGAVSNVHVEYNTFQNIAFGPNGSTEFPNWTSTVGVFIDTSTNGADISHNTFHNISAQVLSEYDDWNLGATAIFGYNLSNTTITYNTIDTVNEGIHFFAGQHVQIDNNTLSHFHRIGMEIQDNTGNLEIGYNTFEQPLNPYWLTFGISVAITGGGANVHNNMLDDQIQEACGANCYVGYGIEAWGNGTSVTNNTIQGYWGNGVAIGPSSGLHVTGNHICGPEMDKPPSGYVVNQRNTKWSGEVIANNGTSTSMVCGN